MTPALARRLYWLAIALVCGSVALAAGGLAWRLAGPAGPSRGASAPAFAEAAAVSIDPILALTLFGRIAEPEAPAPAGAGAGLDLTLHGVVIAADPAASIAIVSGPAGPAGAYAPGQAIGAATLAEVHADHVVLETGDGRTALAFPVRRDAGAEANDFGDEFGLDSGDDPGEDPDADLGRDLGVDLGGGGLDALRALALEQAADPEAAEAADPPSEDGFSGDMPPDDGPADGRPSEAAAAAADPAARVADFRDRLLDDPQALFDDLGLVAGEAGYRVDETAAAEVLRTGLEPGDVVAKVNGQQVGNIDADRRFFDEVAVSDRARLEVVRNGRRILMSFPLR